MLRPGNKHASNGVLKTCKHIIKRLLEVFPKARLILRGDVGFVIPELYKYSEMERVACVLGLIRNKGLERLSQWLKKETNDGYERTGKKQRLFTEARMSDWRVGVEEGE